MAQVLEWVKGIGAVIKNSSTGVIAISTGLLLIVMVWAVVQVQAEYEYTKEIQGIIQENSAKVQVYEEYVRRNLQEADILTLLLKAEYEEHEGITPIIHAAMGGIHNSPVQQIAIADREGKIIASRVPRGYGVYVGDRENFSFHRGNTEGKLHITGLQISRTTGEWSFTVSRRLENKNGSFAGMVAVVINPRYFVEFYESFQLGSDSGMFLVGTHDGRVRAQSYFNSDERMFFPSDSQLMKEIQKRDTGFFKEEGSNRFVSYRVMPDFPLIVGGWLGEESQLVNYLQRKKVYYIWAFATTLFILLSFAALLLALYKQQQTRNKLYQSQQQYRQLVQDAECIIIRWNSRGRISFINEFGEAFFGYTSRELVGQPLTSLFTSPESAVRLQDSVVHKRFMGSPIRQVIEAYCKNGEKVWCQWTNHILRDEDDVIIGGVGVGMAVTARFKVEQALAESEGRLRAIIDSAMDCIFVKNREGRYLLVNSKMEEHLGVSQSELIYKTDEEIFGKKAAEAIGRKDARVFSGETLEMEDQVFRQGREYTFHTIIVPLYDLNGDIYGLCGVSRDITERKQAEEELKRTSQEKIDAIEKTSRYERLASVGTMVASVAHEVNQPLNALKVTVDGMLYWHQRGRQLKSEQVIENCQKISRYAERISKTVKHLRAFATYRPLEEMEPVDINQAVEGALELVGAQLAFRKIEVRKRLSCQLPAVLGDMGRMEELIINLLINAMQAMEPNELTEIKEIEIVTAKENGHVLLEIQDTGAGLPEDILEKVFEPFYTTKIQGMGLGLSIVKSIVEAHKGEIYAQNREGGGAVFRIRFPVGRS